MQRWFSARIGEGLIFDLRTRSSIMYFKCRSHSSPGPKPESSYRRLNSDVIGAQQAFTSTLSTVLSNLISLVLVLAAMIVLSWQLTLAALIMFPVFLSRPRSLAASWQI